MPEPIIHKDIIGNEIKLGDTIVSPNGTELYLGSVIKINPKMIKVKLFVKSGKRSYTREELRYPYNLLVVDDPKIMLYLING